ncbi:MAG: HD domain-containing protein [Phycisphaeraceae bacterium]|nr:HD domain-containing protein [Phycisphaeraceae bacterium]
MLLCGIDDIQPGMAIAAAVMHPDRPETELVKPGYLLDARLIGRLKDFGVERIWIEHDATADLDKHIKIGKSPGHQAMVETLKNSIQDAATKTISAADVLSYRQAVMDMVCELMGSPALAALAERMNRSNDGEMLRHGANVAYLSILIGLQMETYIIEQRPKLSAENAKDLTAMGIGAMLHDVGKIAEVNKTAQQMNALIEHRLMQGESGEDTAEDGTPWMSAQDAYRNHTLIGYRLLEKANAPASARQIVLTHHQRWDGGGFPEMEQVTRGRQQGTQSEEQIHIFSRIVCAADLLDHLLHDASESGRPTIAALKAFRGSEFASWMDPVIRDAVLRTVPPFAVGSHVKLSDGRSAAVIAPNELQPCRPVLRELEDDRGEAAEPITLSEHPDLSITHLLGEPIENYLFKLPERAPLAKCRLRAG